MADGIPTVDAAAARRVLEERARALCRPLQVEDEPGETVELVVLSLGQERYGVDVSHVVEIQPLPNLTPVPGISPVWAGLVNLRGSLCPVLDLRRYLSMQAQDGVDGGNGDGKLVLVSGAGLSVGLLVDEVPGVRRVPAAEIGPALSAAPGGSSEIVRGLTADLVTVLDVEAMLRDRSLAVRHEPSEGEAER